MIVREITTTATLSSDTIAPQLDVEKELIKSYHDIARAMESCPKATIYLAIHSEWYTITKDQASTLKSMLNKCGIKLSLEKIVRD